jgi:hypothetical protein
MTVPVNGRTLFKSFQTPKIVDYAQAGWYDLRNRIDQQDQARRKRVV